MLINRYRGISEIRRVAIKGREVEGLLRAWVFSAWRFSAAPGYTRSIASDCIYADSLLLTSVHNIGKPMYGYDYLEGNGN